MNKQQKNFFKSYKLLSPNMHSAGDRQFYTAFRTRECGGVRFICGYMDTASKEIDIYCGHDYNNALMLRVVYEKAIRENVKNEVDPAHGLLTSSEAEPYIKDAVFVKFFNSLFEQLIINDQIESLKQD